MAVFTTLDTEEMDLIIKPYGLGEVIHFNGVSEGIENTNYAIKTSLTHLAQEYGHEKQGNYFLTIFEELPEHDLNFHLSLLEQLHRAQIPVSLPIRDYDGKQIQWISDKPAVLCPRLYGHHINNPTSEDCKKVGAMLAKIHEKTRTIEYPSGGIRGADWLEAAFSTVSSSLSGEEQRIGEEYLTAYLNIGDSLPQCIIHGDLFKDNVLFEQGNLTGVIDFFIAGRGYALYDLAVCCIDWCIDNRNMNMENMRALLSGYETMRRLTEKEQSFWHLMLVISALRFWLSRTLANRNLTEKPSELNIFKSPEPFRELFHYLINEKNRFSL